MPDFLPPSALAPTPEVRKSGNGIALSVDLARSYLPHLEAQSIRRALLVMTDEYILGADVVSTGKRSSIEWNIHSGERIIAADLRTALNFSFGESKGCTLRLICLSTQDVGISTGVTEFVPAYPNDGTRDYFLRVTGTGGQVSFFWCLALNGKEPTAISNKDGRARWEFGSGLRATFDGAWISLEETR
jgi:hypothetical protein